MAVAMALTIILLAVMVLTIMDLITTPLTIVPLIMKRMKTANDSFSENSLQARSNVSLDCTTSLTHAGYGDSCPEGEEPFWSGNMIHQTHLFIFIVAVVHVCYASASIVIALWRMRRWKQFEKQQNHQLQELKNTNLVYGKNAFEYWFWSFWAQFSPTVDESLYLSMRALFIERMEFPDDFDFLSFVVNTLVEEFAVVVRTDWVMWIVAAIWILVPAFLIVTTILAVLVVLLAGTKLEMIGVKLTQLAFLAYGHRGSALLQPIKAPNNLLHR